MVKTHRCVLVLWIVKEKIVSIHITSCYNCNIPAVKEEEEVGRGGRGYNREEQEREEVEREEVEREEVGEEEA